MRSVDDQRVGSAGAFVRGDALVAQRFGERAAGSAEAVGAQRDRSGRGDCGAEGAGLRAQLGLQVQLQPVGQGPPVGQTGGLAGGRCERAQRRWERGGGEVIDEGSQQNHWDVGLA